MTTGSKKPLNLFYCYARVDKAFRDALDSHLSPLKYQNQIISWSDREISPGTDWAKEIDTHLNTAHIILLLVSADFMASNYCYGVEMKRALERHHAGTARVIPIILRRTFWEEAPFSTLQVLPTDAKPVTHWQDRDEAFWDITVGIRKAILNLRILLKTKQEWTSEGIALNDLKRYEEALAAYEQAIRLDPHLAAAYNNKGITLDKLTRSKEAQQCYKKARQLGYNR
jgi:tetratricopeptide (TPR) repeat protein